MLQAPFHSRFVAKAGFMNIFYEPTVDPRDLFSPKNIRPAYLYIQKHPASECFIKFKLQLLIRMTKQAKVNWNVLRERKRSRHKTHFKTLKITE